MEIWLIYAPLALCGLLALPLALFAFRIRSLSDELDKLSSELARHEEKASGQLAQIRKLQEELNARREAGSPVKPADSVPVKDQDMENVVEVYNNRTGLVEKISTMATSASEPEGERSDPEENSSENIDPMTESDIAVPPAASSGQPGLDAQDAATEAEFAPEDFSGQPHVAVSAPLSMEDEEEEDAPSVLPQRALHTPHAPPAARPQAPAAPPVMPPYLSRKAQTLHLSLFNGARKEGELSRLKTAALHLDGARILHLDFHMILFLLPSELDMLKVELMGYGEKGVKILVSNSSPDLRAQLKQAGLHNLVEIL